MSNLLRIIETHNNNNTANNKIRVQPSQSSIIDAPPRHQHYLSTGSGAKMRMQPRGYRLYVNGLHIRTTEAEFRQLFSQIGRTFHEFIQRATTDVNQITTYGFVSYETLEEAEMAIDQFGGYVHKGVEMKVQLSNNTKKKSNMNNNTAYVVLPEDEDEDEFYNKLYDDDLFDDGDGDGDDDDDDNDDHMKDGEEEVVEVNDTRTAAATSPQSTSETRATPTPQTAVQADEGMMVKETVIDPLPVQAVTPTTTQHKRSAPIFAIQKRSAAIAAIQKRAVPTEERSVPIVAIEKKSAPVLPIEEKPVPVPVIKETPAPVKVIKERAAPVEAIEERAAPVEVIEEMSPAVSALKEMSLPVSVIEEGSTPVAKDPEILQQLQVLSGLVETLKDQQEKGSMKYGRDTVLKIAHSLWDSTLGAMDVYVPLIVKGCVHENGEVRMTRAQIVERVEMTMATIRCTLCTLNKSSSNSKQFTESLGTLLTSAHTVKEKIDVLHADLKDQFNKLKTQVAAPSSSDVRNKEQHNNNNNIDTYFSAFKMGYLIGNSAQRRGNISDAEIMSSLSNFLKGPNGGGK